MSKGISPKFKEPRRQLLSHNGPDVVDQMQQSGLADPVTHNSVQESALNVESNAMPNGFF